MRSLSTDRHAGTLVGRVATAAALAAVGAALLAAMLVVVLAHAAITAAETRRLRDEAEEALVAVEALAGDGAIARAIEAERRDMAPAGLRLAIYRGDAFAGGDASLRLHPAGCAVHYESHALHACVARRGSWATVVAADEAPGLGLRTNGAILAGAVLIAAIAGALASRKLAAWALGPLARLRARLGEAAVDLVELGEDDGVREIDALRGTLQALLHRRAEALRSARVFAAGAAHELRTPLAHLSGDLELLAEEPACAPALERVQALRSSAARIGALVERLLMLASLDAAQAMRQDAVDLGDLLDDLRERLPTEALERLSVAHYGPSLVRGDESLLAVLCENAVGNALLHAHPAAVRVELDEHAGDVTIDVMDDGPGIPHSERARLFQPFQRGAGAAPGAGLGLALVAQIARAHGGEARFTDASRGAHLHVRIPRWAPRNATMQKHASVGAHAATE